MIEGWNKFFDQLCADYGLSRSEHFWKHPKSRKYIMFHKTVKVISIKDSIKTMIFPMEERDGEGGTHIMSGAVAWIDGDNDYQVYVTKRGIFLVDEKARMLSEPNDILYHVGIKASKIAVDVGEGSSSNYQAGYKYTIVNKRAEDRAVIELIQAKYHYELFSDQDAEVMNGMRYIPDPDDDSAEKKLDTTEIRIASEFNRLKKSLEEYIKTFGPERANEWKESNSEALSRLNERYAKMIDAKIANAKRQKAENEEAIDETDEVSEDDKMFMAETLVKWKESSDREELETLAETHKEGLSKLSRPLREYMKSEFKKIRSDKKARKN